MNIVPLEGSFPSLANEETLIRNLNSMMTFSEENALNFFDHYVFPRLLKGQTPCLFLQTLKGKLNGDQQRIVVELLNLCEKYATDYQNPPSSSEVTLVENDHLSCDFMKGKIQRDFPAVLPALLQYTTYVLNHEEIQNKKKHLERDLSDVLFPLIDSKQGQFLKENLDPKLKYLNPFYNVLKDALDFPIGTQNSPYSWDSDLPKSPSPSPSPAKPPPKDLSMGPGVASVSWESHGPPKSHVPVTSPNSQTPPSSPQSQTSSSSSLSVHRRRPATHVKVPSYARQKWLDEQLQKPVVVRTMRKPLRVKDVKVPLPDTNEWDDIEIDLSPSPVQASSFFQNSRPPSVSFPRRPPKQVSSLPIRQFNPPGKRVQTFINAPLRVPKPKPQPPKHTPVPHTTQPPPKHTPTLHDHRKRRTEPETLKKQFLVDYMDRLAGSGFPKKQTQFMKSNVRQREEQKPIVYPKLEPLKVDYPKLNPEDVTLKFHSTFSQDAHLKYLRTWTHLHRQTPFERIKHLFVNHWLKDAVDSKGGRGCQDLIRELSNRVDPQKDGVLYDLLIFARKMCYSRYVMQVMHALEKYPRLEAFLFDSLLCRGRDTDIFEVWKDIYKMKNHKEREVAINGWRIFVYFGLLHARKSCDSLLQKLRLVGNKANYLKEQGVFKEHEGIIQSLGKNIRELFDMCEATKEDTRRSLKDELDILGKSVAKGMGKYCSRRAIHKPQVIHKPKRLQRSRSI